MRRALATLLTLCSLVMAVLPGSAFAGTREISYDAGVKAGAPTGIALITPDTYASCVNTVVTDVVKTTGVGTRLLKGQVIVEYVTDSGRQPVPGGFYSVNQTGDLNLTISYPPVSQWPVLANGTREIHVDVQIELYEGGFKVATLGPGSDWDVFCTSGPPPPEVGGQGCTPGYWKQRQHFDSWTAPYAPTTSFRSVFGAGPNISLLEALNARGGGEKALQRHGVAALLNAASGGVDYKYNVAGVISIVQQAYASGDFEPIKNMFEEQNELGCPLN